MAEKNVLINTILHLYFYMKRPLEIKYLKKKQKKLYNYFFFFWLRNL